MLQLLMCYEGKSRKVKGRELEGPANVSLVKTLTTVTDQPTVYVCDIPLFLLHFLHSIFIARALEVVV